MTKSQQKISYISPAQRIMRLLFSALGPVFPKLLGGLAYHLWFIPVRFKTPAHEISAIDTATHSTLDINGTPVSIMSWGKAPFVLFIHGWSGRGAQVSPFLDGLLSAGYGVISFDGPAHGKTPGKKTNVLEMSEAVLAINKEYGTFHAAITHSFAGMIIAYVMSKGLQVQRVVSISPPDTMDAVANVMKYALTIPDNVMKALNDKTTSAFGDDFSKKMSTVNNAKNIKADVLIIHDEDDEDVPWQSGQAVADAYKNSRFIRTQGLGHRRIIRDPEVVKATIEFITQ